MPRYDNNGNYADPMEQLQHEFRVWREHLIERVFSGRHAWQSHEDISEPFEALVNRIPLATPKYVHQFLTSNGEWDTVVNDDGTPSTFDTQAEADADMEVFHSFATGAVSRGDMDDHNRADWRVAELEG
jgi:hypothetical protein